MNVIDSEDILIRQVADLNEKAALSIVKERIQAGYDPFRIIESCKEGVHQVGVRYEKGEYFIAGLIMAGIILRGVIDLVRSALQHRIEDKRRGNVVLGTIQGDIHDIGKNLAGLMLSSEGFNVIDLGVDISPADFVSGISEYKPKIVVLCSLLTTVFENLKTAVDSIEEAGLRSGLCILIAGSMVNETVCEFSQADHWTNDAVKGVQWCKRVAPFSR